MSPSVIVRLVLSRLTPVTEITFAVTVTVQVAVLAPSVVCTVIVAVPADLAITTPVEETIATDSLFDDQVTDLSVALDGETVALRLCVSPSVIVRLVLSRLTPDTETLLDRTVNWQVAVLPPSLVLTVIVAVPRDFAETIPEEETVATVVLLEAQVTD